MKGQWLLLAALAGCISAEARQDRSFMTVCSELELDPSRGLLNAFCSSQSSGKADHVSQVDLNGCLGWGPTSDFEPIPSVENELYPARWGNFSQFCNSCHIIREDESATQAGHILCNCAPKDSDIELEYMFDLTKIVDIDGSGCLTCGKAPSLCNKRPESDPILEGEPVSLADVPRLFDGQLLSFPKTNISDCDAFVGRALLKWPNAIPKTFESRPIRPCQEEAGPGLCCFFPVENKGYFEQGFQLLEDSNYIYRLQYGKDNDRKYTELELVLRYCKNPRKCPDGEPDDNAGPSLPNPRFPKPTNTSASTTSSTNPSFVSTRPSLVATPEKKGIRSSTTSRNVTGVPDIYFPTPTLTSGTLSRRDLVSASNKSADPHLKIDLSKLNAPKLINIMLDATNMDEVRHAHLNLLVSINCFTYRDGQVTCKEVVVELTGHLIDGNSTKTAGTGTDVLPQSATTPEAESTKTSPSSRKAYELTRIKTLTHTVTVPTAMSLTSGPSTTTATVLNYKTDSGSVQSTELSERFHTSLPQIDDIAQAVLGPRAATSTKDLQAPDFSTVGHKSTTTSQSKKLKKTKTTKTKTKKVTTTELKPTTKTVTDTKHTVTMTETQTVTGNATQTLPSGLEQRTQSLAEDNTRLIADAVVTSALPTKEDVLGSTISNTPGSKGPESSVIVTYVTEVGPLPEITTHASPTWPAGK